MVAYRLSKTTAPLSTRVPLQQARSLQRLAARRGMSVSDVLGVLVEREFAADEQTTPTQLTHTTITNNDEPLAA
jgi:hypothetical protein